MVFSYKDKGGIARGLYSYLGLEIVRVQSNQIRCDYTFQMVHESKDEHCITQKDTQPSQTCSGGFIKTQLCAICWCFFAIKEYIPIQ